jgi:hypothetical protein
VDRQQDASGDYGYDLAHEATGRGADPEERPAGDEVERQRPVVPADSGEDLGYDEAHDFRPG